MQLNFPKFWQSRTLLSYILLPFSILYYFGFKLRALITVPFKSPIPIICIGNINLGGSGKTPIALSVARFFIEKGKKVIFVSKGYKGRLIGPVKVEPSHTATDVGDEPLLLSKLADCIIAKCRKTGVKAAATEGADIIIMDDGMQNPTIYKDLSIIVVDGEIGFGNGFLLPAGPLRETVQNALARKPNMVVIVRDDKRNITSVIAKMRSIYGNPQEPCSPHQTESGLLHGSLSSWCLTPGSPFNISLRSCIIMFPKLLKKLVNLISRMTTCHVITPSPNYGDEAMIKARIAPITSNLDSSKKYITFAGIGNPEKFFTTLKEANIQLADTIAFPDHYPYTETDIEQLLEKAKVMEAYLITTEKDIVRIAPKYHEQIIVLGIEIAWQDPNQLEKNLAKFL
jgi:tetraacyldisaccharide-1-P 4'-kinase